MTFALLVDFSGNGDFSGGNDDITDRVMSIRTFRGLSDPYSRVADETYIEVTLRNNDRRFSPENTGGIYYGALRSGLRVAFKFSTTFLDTAFTAQFVPTTGLYAGNNTCRLTCKGVKWYYERSDRPIPILQNISAYEAVERYISELGDITPVEIATTAALVGITGRSEVGTATVGDIADYVTVDAAQTTLEIVGHNVTRDEYGRANLYELFSDIVWRESGWMYPDRTGLLTFKERHSWTYDNTLDVTWNNDFNEPPVYITPQDDLINVVKIQGAAIEVADGAASDIIYQQLNTLTLAPGESSTWYASAIQEGRKRSATALKKPSGGDFVLSSGSAEVKLLDDKGQDFGLEVVAGDAGATIDTLIVRGDFVSEEKFTIISTNDDAIDTLDGQRNMESFDLKLMEDQLEALNYANHELVTRGNTNGRIETVSKVYQSDELTTSTDVIQYDIGTLIRVVEDQTGHDERYRVVGVERVYDAASYTLQTIWTLLPSPYQYWCIVGVSTVGDGCKVGY